MPTTTAIPVTHELGHNQHVRTAGDQFCRVPVPKPVGHRRFVDIAFRADLAKSGANGRLHPRPALFVDEDVLRVRPVAPDPGQQFEQHGMQDYGPGLVDDLCGFVFVQHDARPTGVEMAPLGGGSLGRPRAGELEEHQQPAIDGRRVPHHHLEFRVGHGAPALAAWPGGAGKRVPRDEAKPRRPAEHGPHFGRRPVLRPIAFPPLVRLDPNQKMIVSGLLNRQIAMSVEEVRHVPPFVLESVGVFLQAVDVLKVQIGHVTERMDARGEDRDGGFPRLAPKVRQGVHGSSSRKGS
jgi:hypothetical protein